MDLGSIIKKYSLSGPRYTSYPTAPQWSEEISRQGYRDYLTGPASQNADRPLALYFHIPYCESLCYYCGCNIQITHLKEKGPTYTDSLLKEVRTVSGLLSADRPVTQISWGGGTPTFLAIREIEKLHRGTLDHFRLSPEAEVSIEVDPRVTSHEQLETLAALGFNRISLGVQDFDPVVQKAINRIQTAEMTEATLKKCRALGFRGINFDLMYGLPYQTIQSFEKTINEVIRQKPDRIALYNYARLPSMIKHQTILEEMPMPSAEDRVSIFDLAYHKLIESGYQSIGMDHFALETDELYQALHKGNLHRNFMGYTVKKGTDMIGFGASAIGEWENAYFQNVREARNYEPLVSGGELATFRGCVLSPDDARRKYIIQSIMCRFVLDFDEYETRYQEDFEKAFGRELSALPPLAEEGFLNFSPRKIEVTPLGRLFVRNVAMVFDAYLKGGAPVTYSKTV